MSWDHDVKTVDVSRTGDAVDIFSIDVTAVRMRTKGTRTRIEVELRYKMEDDDNVAYLQRATTTSNDHGTYIHHLAALLPIVEQAVKAIPDVDRVEQFEGTVSQRRTERDE